MADLRTASGLWPGRLPLVPPPGNHCCRRGRRRRPPEPDCYGLVVSDQLRFINDQFREESLGPQPDYVNEEMAKEAKFFGLFVTLMSVS